MTQHERFNFEDQTALARRIHELGLDIPLSDDPGILLTSIDVGGRRVPNRLVVQPMEGRDAGTDGTPGPLAFRRYRRYAAGGSGLIWFEATAVVPEGRAAPTQLCISPDNLHAFRKLVSETRHAARESLGRNHAVLLILQLTHAGRYARPGDTRRPIIAHHNPVLDPSSGIDPDHPLISDEELDHLQGAFVAAARLAAEAGFDGVDVKACHGYLVSELLAAFTRTNSRYGGSFDNRTRFLREVVSRIGDQVPEILLTSRISAYDGLAPPYGFGVSADHPTKEDLAEPVELARRLRDAGCALLNISAGNPYYNPHVGRPFNTPAKGDHAPDEHPLVGVARLLRITGTLQQAVGDLPLVGSGYSWLRQHFPNVGAAIVERGRAGFVGVGRNALAYPDCVKDLAEWGRLDPAKVCEACSGCTQLMRAGEPVGCVTRDREVYQPRRRRPGKQGGDAV